MGNIRNKGEAMAPEWSTWINRTGLIFDMLAFWFAAPEIIGEAKLRGVIRLLIGIVKMLVMFLIAAIVILVPLYFGVLQLIGSGIFPPNPDLSPEQIWAMGIAEKIALPRPWGLIVSIILIILSFVDWFLFKFGFEAYNGSGRSDVLVDSVSEFILAPLLKNSDVRYRALLIGSVLFMLGFLLQFIATL
jgi:hypothetical protein